MRVLDLFAGHGGFSAAFIDRGHNVTTLDNERRFRPNILADIREVAMIGGKYDVVLASPPCEVLSVAAIGRNWTKGWRSTTLTPRTDKAIESLDIVANALRLIEQIQPTVWVLENPRAALRKLAIMEDYESCYITQCQYGRHTQKPTDLWGTIQLLVNNGFDIRACEPGSDCHNPAPRGTRGERDAAKRAIITYGLSLELCIAAERATHDHAIDKGNQPST